jgi:hypothetical protein
MGIWREDVLCVLRELGGEATLGQIYAAMRDHRPDLPRAWKASIRKTLQDHTPECVAYRYTVYPGPALFYRNQSGRWGVREGVESASSAPRKRGPQPGRSRSAGRPGLPRSDEAGASLVMPQPHAVRQR